MKSLLLMLKFGILNYFPPWNLKCLINFVRAMPVHLEISNSLPSQIPKKTNSETDPEDDLRDDHNHAGEPPGGQVTMENIPWWYLFNEYHIRSNH